MGAHRARAHTPDRDPGPVDFWNHPDHPSGRRPCGGVSAALNLAGVAVKKVPMLSYARTYIWLCDMFPGGGWQRWVLKFDLALTILEFVGYGMIWLGGALAVWVPQYLHSIPVCDGQWHFSCWHTVAEKQAYDLTNR